MRTTDKSKNKFESKPFYEEKKQFSSFGKSANVNEVQQFVVPWQMLKTKERKYMVK